MLAEAIKQRDARSYFTYLVEAGGQERYGSGWRTPERQARLDLELPVIYKADFHLGLVMLSDLMGFCRRENIPYGPGRGSVGGCYTAYLLGVHEVDSIEWDLDFERFLNPDRISFPDVDIDVSQRYRDRVLDYIVNTYQRDDQIVLRVGAFRRATGRAVVDAVAAAMNQTDPDAYAIATELKKCFPDGNISGGVKIARELGWWLDSGHGDKARFREIAEQAGWLEHLLALDGMFTNLTSHAAGAVILRTEDLPYLPQTSLDGKVMVTGYDMYALDDLGYLKWDILGLRTLDVIADAHRFIGGSGATRDLIALWEEHRNDPDVYEVFQDADTVGIFQMETPGYRRTLRDFQPENFEHLVQLVALYRPGALDFQRKEDNKNMVEVFIDRRHGREPASYLHPSLENALRPTHGIMVYQEQQMRVARDFAGFTLAQADLLRKAIGKKRPEEMAKLIPLWEAGTKDKPKALADLVWKNIEAAARYSWNRSHSVEYAIITWLTAFFKRRYPHAFYAALINSYEDTKDRQADAIAEARQHIEFRPPDIAVAEDRFTVDGHDVVFGLNGIKGMGEANRDAILIERAINGPYTSYEDFCHRLPSVPSNMKKALVACGAFDALGEDRVRLLATCPKGNQRYNVWLSCGCVSQKLKSFSEGDILRCAKCKVGVTVTGCAPIERKSWHVLEHINALAKNDTKVPLSSPLEWIFPTDTELARGELDAMGYYISSVPLSDVAHELGRMSSNVTGGEIAERRLHNDKRGNQMCTLTLTTPALTKQTVRIFASNWPQCEPKVIKGAKLLFRGREDNGVFLADACWEVGDYRHFRKLKLSKDGEAPKMQTFDGSAATIRDAEQAGFRVRLL